jgi:hypothetical protein
MWHGPLRTTSPPTSINDDLILGDAFHEILNANQQLFVGKNFQHAIVSGGSNDVQTRFSAKFLKQCFVYVITETVGEYPYPYFSEKTWRSMVSQVPFMIVGAPGSLQQLRNMGFKTFNCWWSEDYDSLPSVSQRIESMVSELKKLSNYSISDLRAIRVEMESTIQHNYDHLATFIAADLANVQGRL